MIKTDILVVGTGLAGSIAAITAADMGKNVTVITKTDSILSGSTIHAQGGIIYRGVNDSVKSLTSDIMDAGSGHCYAPAVEQLAKLGPELVEDILINRFKVEFDKASAPAIKGNYTQHKELDIPEELVKQAIPANISLKDEGYCLPLDLTAEGAHSIRRIIHCKDFTGRSIAQQVMKTLATHPNITIITNHIAVELLTLAHHSKNSVDIYKHPACFGALVFDCINEHTFPVFAGKTILATGGLGQLFLHTTNPVEATGDGLALASRAGVRCFNLEYIQFHPTSFYSEMQTKVRFLISEAVRGEGGVLIDKCSKNHGTSASYGNDFMKRFHKMGSLAPRDVVARGIQTMLIESGNPCVYLDITSKSEEWLKNRFPDIFNQCLKFGINISKEPIPVVPAAHYACGGIGVNLNGRTSFQRLYAVGEIACTGVHGANRLASTSLLEALVWGYTAGKDASQSKEDDGYFPPIYDWVSETEDIDTVLLVQDWSSIKNTMWNYVGIFRTKQRLQRAIKMLRELQIEIEKFYKNAKLSRQIIELRNGIEAAIAITNATIAAPISRGAHCLADEVENS